MIVWNLCNTDIKIILARLDKFSNCWPLSIACTLGGRMHAICRYRGYFSRACFIWNRAVWILLAPLALLAELLLFRRRPSVRRPLTQVSRKLLHRSRPICIGSYLYIISPDHVLALLDCVSRPYSMRICPSSVRRPCPNLSQNLLDRFLSNFSCCLRWPIRPDVFWIFEKKNAFPILFFVFVNMGPYGSKQIKRCSSLKSLLNIFKPFLNFLLNGPHKSTVLDFLKLWVYDF